MRHVELDIDIGADARDWSAIQAQEKLKPVDTELRRIEASVNEIVQEMEYLRIREQKLRDTNESTNERVKWFALGTMGMLVGLGAWQVVYLRAYFRYVFSVLVRFSSLYGGVVCAVVAPPGPGRLRECFGYFGTNICSSTDRSISSRQTYASCTDDRQASGLAWPQPSGLLTRSWRPFGSHQGARSPGARSRVVYYETRRRKKEKLFIAAGLVKLDDCACHYLAMNEMQKQALT